MLQHMLTRRLTRLSILPIAVLGVATAVWAQDWRQMGAMNEAQLKGAIAQLQQKLTQSPSDYETIKSLGIAHHFGATKDPNTHAAKAVELLTKARKLDRNDTVTMAYLGSATTMLSRTTDNRIERLNYANKGIALMDKAVRRDPDNMRVRLVRGANSANLPAMLNRGEVALEDFEYLAAMIEKQPDTPRPLQKVIYTHLMNLYRKSGQLAKAEAMQKRAEAL